MQKYKICAQSITNLIILFLLIITISNKSYSNKDVAKVDAKDIGKLQSHPNNWHFVCGNSATLNTQIPLNNDLMSDINNSSYFDTKVLSGFGIELGARKIINKKTFNDIYLDGQFYFNEIIDSAPGVIGVMDQNIGATTRFGGIVSQRSKVGFSLYGFGGIGILIREVRMHSNQGYDNNLEQVTSYGKFGIGTSAFVTENGTIVPSSKEKSRISNSLELFMEFALLLSSHANSLYLNNRFDDINFYEQSYLGIALSTGARFSF